MITFIKNKNKGTSYKLAPAGGIILNPNTSMNLSAEKRAIHEAGHNASHLHLHNTGNFEYQQKGLQNNINPKPSRENTKTIINDKHNRKTIK